MQSTRGSSPSRSRQSAVNTWTCYTKYESPSKFEKFEETTIEVFASTQVEEENNPHPIAPSSPPRRSRDCA
jgi:hypothetical protein